MFCQAIPFRILETFSSKDMVARYIKDPQRQNLYLEDLYKYLIKRKYFTLVRKLMDTKVPLLYDEVLSPPNSISDTLLQMVRHPLKLLSQMDNTPNVDLVNLILSSFIEEILAPVYTPAIQLFLIPCLANSSDFPFLLLLQRLNEIINRTYVDVVEDTSHDEIPMASASAGQLTGFDRNATVTLATNKRLLESSYLLHALLKLDTLFLDELKKHSHLLCAYIRILARLSNTIRNLPRSSKPLTYRITDEEDDDDADDSDTKDYRRAGEQTIGREEINILTEAIDLLNEQQRAGLIVDNNGLFLNNADVLHSLCNICHNLMLYHRSAIYEYK